MPPEKITTLFPLFSRSVQLRQKPNLAMVWPLPPSSLLQPTRLVSRSLQVTFLRLNQHASILSRQPHRLLPKSNTRSKGNQNRSLFEFTTVSGSLLLGLIMGRDSETVKEVQCESAETQTVKGERDEKKYPTSSRKH